MMRFSIITPSFNQLDWLRLCAASVADQERVELEHIVQDAGTEGIEEFTRRHEATEGGGLANQCQASTLPPSLPLTSPSGPPQAGSPAHSRAPVVNSASPLSSQHSTLNAQLQIVSEPDAGMYDAINRGLRRATGEIRAWLNCDEQYLPGALARVALFMEGNPGVDVVFGDAILVDPGGQGLSYRRAVLPTRTHTRLAHLNTLSCATFFRRSIVERGLLFSPEYKAIGDAVWIHQLLEERVPMAVLREPLAAFTLTGSNLSQDPLAAAEGLRWRTGGDAPAAWRRWPAILGHRIRKLLAGAYVRRSADVRIYTRESPHARRCFACRGLAYQWPRNIARSPSPDAGRAQGGED